MRKITKKIHAYVGDFSELTNEEKNLLLVAAKVQLNAQAPYSHFHVGAAVLSEKEVTYSGCNVERCSWTQTTHAEQSAIDDMIKKEGPTKVKLIAIVAVPIGEKIDFKKKNNCEPIEKIEDVPVPCGHCLQIIWENCFNDPDVRLVALAHTGEVIRTTIGDAFPMRFGPKDLGVDYNKNKK